MVVVRGMGDSVHLLLRRAFPSSVRSLRGMGAKVKDAQRDRTGRNGVGGG